MKNLSSAALRYNRPSFAVKQSIFFIAVICIGSLLTACKKEKMNAAPDEISITSPATPETERNPLNQYTGLSPLTLWELQQARAASAIYQNINNAIADGYSDISVVVPNMGHHYLKAANLDATFDYKKPEILVYNRHEDGNFELVAVEYAVPISLTPNTAPEGFSGSNDVWDRNTGFGLWLLHAWVWAYNPDGVFNPTNPLVHTH